MKLKFYNMAHTHYNILIIIIRGIFGIHKTSKIELFAKVVTSFKTSNSFAKISILEVCLVFQFTSDYFVNTSDRFIYLRRRQLIDNNCSPLPRDINHPSYHLRPVKNNAWNKPILMFWKDGMSKKVC